MEDVLRFTTFFIQYGLVLIELCLSVPSDTPVSSHMIGTGERQPLLAEFTQKKQLQKLKVVGIKIIKYTITLKDKVIKI